MSNKAIDLAATPRTEFGKGAARRARRAGLIPVVVYGPGFEPKHINVERLEFTAIVRNHGLNTVVSVDIDGGKQLAMIKAVDQNVLSLEIDHADLLAIHRGEEVEVEVPVVSTGETGPGAMVIQEADTIRVTADVLSIPDEIAVPLDGREIGSQIHAGDIRRVSPWLTTPSCWCSTSSHSPALTQKHPIPRLRQKLPKTASNHSCENPQAAGLGVLV